MNNMNKAAIYHRPESEFAYLYAKNLLHIRIKAAKDDVESVELVYGDPYLWLDNYQTWDKTIVEMTKISTTSTADYFQAEVTLPTKRVEYMFIVTGKNGEKVIYNDHGAYPFEEKHIKSKWAGFRMPYFHEVDRFKAPEWVKNTVWYQIFPERFANGNPELNPAETKAWNPAESPERQDFYGGDLQGVIDHLDHLTDLGVNGIYFTPIFKASSNHKYDTEDYLEIDPHFGDKKIFKQLIEAAHERGIKVMLDAVFNHIGDNSDEWQDVLKHQEQSKYADWFHVNEWPASYIEIDNFENAKTTYDTFASTPHMPKLNTANEEVQAYLLNVADYWIREFDIDAWRLDVADEVDHNFWKKFRQTCDAAKDDFYILGEVWHSSQSWMNGDEFTAVMNYAYTGAIKDGIIGKTISIDDMISEINHQLMLYRKQASQVMFNVLDSHDTPRILFEAKGDKKLVKLVEAFTYMQPGTPCIYYGDEYALDGAGDPDCRRCMPWEPNYQDQDMYQFFKKLIAFRLEHTDLLSESDVKWTLVDNENRVVKMERGELKAIFNMGEHRVLFNQENILLESQLDGDYINPTGFVIYK